MSGPSRSTAASQKWQVTIDLDWCKACGICSNICPKRVFDVDTEGYPAVSRVSDCIGCNLCEQLCPDLAVTVRDVSGRVRPSEGDAA